MKVFVTLLCTLGFGWIFAQYAPAPGLPGSEAISKDDLSISHWPIKAQVHRGYINISDTNATYTFNDSTSNRAFFGSDSSLVGKQFGPAAMVSLGDSGYATLEFELPIINGPGFDLVVFENGFKLGSDTSYYLELAFVELSLDGNTYYRFPTHSLTQTDNQVSDAEGLNPTKLDGFAGKYPANYGVGFDLDRLYDIHPNAPRKFKYVRVVDAVGSINRHQQFDSQGNVVNDPYPTPYFTGGFDLMAVGAIHTETPKEWQLVNHPFVSGAGLELYGNLPNNMLLLNAQGQKVAAIETGNIGDFRFEKSGLYFLVDQDQQQKTLKILVR